MKKVSKCFADLKNIPYLCPCDYSFIMINDESKLSLYDIIILGYYK